MIGINAPKAHIQTDFREGRENQPIAVCTRLGWSILGTTSRSESDEIQAKVHFIVQRDQQLHQQIEQFWKTESFGVICNDIKATSVEDRISQHILQNSTRLTDGHYEISMLWKTNSDLPCNFRTAEQLYVSLAKRLRTNKEFERMYSSTINSYIQKGYAKKLTENEKQQTSQRTWYLPHHGVKNPNKPGKVRVVFDAAAKHDMFLLTTCS